MLNSTQAAPRSFISLFLLIKTFSRQVFINLSSWISKICFEQRLYNSILAHFRNTFFCSKSIFQTQLATATLKQSNKLRDLKNNSAAIDIEDTNTSQPKKHTLVLTA